MTAVGFSPRYGGFDEVQDKYEYGGWRRTWLTGQYTIVLTKVCFIHKNYLSLYFSETSKRMLEHIDKNRNCEDLAMAHIIAKTSRAPPVWVEGIVHEIADSGISSGTEHFYVRSECLEFMHQLSGVWPWTVGYQKAVKVSFWDIFKFLFDEKL